MKIELYYAPITCAMAPFIALTEAGVDVGLIDYPGMIHGFMRAIGVVDVAQLAIDEAAVVFRNAFGSA